MSSALRSALIGIFGVAALAASAPVHAQSLTIQGRVITPAGTPLNGASTVFRIKVLSPNSNQCVLYDETQTLNLSGANGLFSINLNSGSGTVNSPSTYSLEQALSNRVGFVVDSQYCASGTGMVSYSPTATDNRKIIIQFRDPSMSGFEEIPAMDLNPVAYAMETRAVGGFPAASLLRLENSGTPAPAASLTSANFAELLALLGGTSTNYMSSTAGTTTGARMPTVSGRPSTPAAGSIWFDTSTNTIKFYNGSTDQTVGVGSATGGTITGVSPGSGIATTVSGSVVTVSLSPSGVGATDTKGSATLVPRITYDTYGRITNIVEQAIGSTLPAAGADHQVLMSSSGSWGASYIGLSDLRKDAGTALFPGTCATNRTLNWNSVSGVFECVDLGSIASAQLAAPTGATAASYRAVDVNAAGQVVGGTNPTTLGGYFISDAVRNGGSVPQIRSGAADPSGAGVDGELYVATTSQKIFRYNLGTTTWETMASAGGAGGTMTGINAGPGIAVTGSAATPTVGLSTAGVTAGTFAKVTTDTYGRVTSGSAQVGDADISDLAFTKLTGKPATLLGHGITENLVTNAGGAASLQAGGTSGRPTPGTAGQIYIDTDTNTVYYRGVSSWQTVASAAGAGGTLTEVYSGAGVNVTSTGTTRTVALTDVGTASSGLVKVNTDAKGRVTGGATTIGNADISDLAFSKLTGTPTTVGDYGITDAVKNPDGTVPTILSGADASLPAAAAGNLNYIYIANDTRKIYRQVSGTWQVIGSGTPVNFSGSLAGEISGTQATTQVDKIGTFLRATILGYFTDLQNATDAKTNGTLVKRDGSGSFAAGAVTADAVVLKGSSSGTATLRAPATVTNYDVQLPATAPAAGQVLSATSGTALAWTTPLSGSTITVAAPITNSSGTIGINTASGSQAGALSSADWATFNNKLGTALSAASIWVGNASNVATAVAPSGDLAMTNAGAFTVNRIRGTAVSAAPSATGQTLRFDGTNYTPSFVAIADLRSKVTGTSAIAATCTSSQTLTWDSVTDNLQCQNISIAAATQISDTVPVSKGGTGVSTTTQNWIFAGPAGANGAPAFRALAAADLPAEAKYWVAATGGINTTAGNVGIGSATPAAKLDIVGSSGATLKIVDGNQALGKILTSDANGVASWQTPASSVSGTAGRMSVFATATSLGDSTVRFSSNSVGINADVPVWMTAGSLYAPTQVYSTFLAAGAKAQAPIVYGSAAASGNLTLDSTSDTTKGIISIAPSGGNVGIGTTAPGSSLHLAGANASDTPAGAITMSRAYSGATATRASSIFHYWDSASGRDMMVFGVSGAASSANQPAQISQAKVAIREDGNVGIGTIVPTVSLDMSSRTDALRVPNGTAAQQPGQASMPAAANGMIRYNSTNNALEAYVNGAWSNLATVGSNQSFAGNVNVGGTFTSTGAATFNGGATVASGGLNLTNTGITNAGNITGVGNNIAASSYVVVAAGGTNQTATLKSSGTAQVNLSTGNGTSFAALDSGGTTVNYVTAKGAAAGGSPIIGTGGSDADINLTFSPKGNGNSVFSAGRLGIGTTAPQSRLHVAGGADLVLDDTNPFLITRSTTYPSATAQTAGMAYLSEGAASSTNLWPPQAAVSFFATENHSASAKGTSIVMGTTPNGSTSYQPRLTIDQSGNVGVGTTSPASALDIVRDSTYNSESTMGLRIRSTNTVGTKSLVLGTDNTAGTTFVQGMNYGTNWGGPLALNPNGGFVGIGTITPASTLDIVSSTPSDQVKLTSTNSSAYTLASTGAGSHTWSMQTGNNASLLNGALRFIQSGTERLRIDAAGNIGIGTSGTTYNLEMAETTGSNNRGIASTTYQPNGGVFVVRAARGTMASPSALVASDYLGFLYASGHDGSGFSVQTNPTAVNFQTTENWTAAAHGSAINFWTTPNGTTSAISRMRIDQNGNVGIGTTAPRGALGFGDTHSNLADCSDEPNGYVWSGACRNDVINVYETGEQKYGLGIHGGTLEVYSQSHIQLGQRAIDGTGNFDARLSIIPGGNVGIGTTNPGYRLEVAGTTANDSGTWAVRSDARLKKDVSQLNDALDRVLKLRGVSFRWKDEKKNKEMGLQRGFIAQEVEKIIPEWVHKGNDGFLHLEKVGIEAYLVESIKQLYQRWFDRDQEIRREVASLAKDNAELKADNAKKTAEIQDLKARMERIEKSLNAAPASKK